MQHEDFDIASLAAYLHLNPQQVDRLVSRGKIPGRRVGGKWRFSPAEIHHWMEGRLGILDDGELARVEGAMSPRDSEAAVDFSLAALLPVSCVAAPLVARSKRSAVDAMCELATTSGLLWDAEKMADAVRAREELQSTAMENGVALLHPRRPLASILGGPVLAFGRAFSGIPFGRSRVLTDLFWLICSVDDRSHLRMLARISRLIADDDLLSQLRSVDDATETHATLIEAEEKLDE